MASNREKLINLIVASSNLEPNEAAELIEGYTNNVADNEVENLINAMTEALGTKAGNKLDTNGIKEVFNIARERSQIKTDQEIAEEQARKQAIAEKQARRTEKAYEVIDQRREQKEAARKEASKEEIEKQQLEKFEANENVINNIMKNIKIDEDVLNKILEQINAKYPTVSENTKSKIVDLKKKEEELRQFEEQAKKQGTSEEELKDQILQIKINQAVEDVVPEESQTKTDKRVKFRVWWKNKFSRKSQDEEKNSQESDPEIALIDEAIKFKQDLLEEYEKELKEKPGDLILLGKVNAFKSNIRELEEGRQEVSIAILQEKAGYVDEEKTIPNTYARLLEYQIQYNEARKIIEEKQALMEANNDPENRIIYSEIIQIYKEKAREYLRKMNFEKSKGSEADFVLNEEIEGSKENEAKAALNGETVEGKIDGQNYKKKIEEYQQMLIENEINSAVTQIEASRERADKASDSTRALKFTHLNEIYKVEKNRIMGGIEIYEGDSTESLITLMQKGGLTKDEVYQVEIGRNDFSKKPINERMKFSQKLEMEKAELDIFSEALGKIAEQGASKEDISMLLKAVQKGRENGEYQLFNSAFPAGKDKQANILKKMMEIHCGKDVDTTICDKFYAECGKLMPNIPLETMFKKDMLAGTALAEERLKYDRTLNRDSKDEVEEPPKKVDKSTIRNIAAGVTKGEIDSITSTLAKDKNKPEITGQEQSDAQSEIES